MARKRRKRLLVPESRPALERLKAQVMSRELGVGPLSPDQVKMEVAKQVGVPLKHGDNGELKTADAGKIGGTIGGNMVREMVKLAQEHLAHQRSQS
jgi:hypothetical protein